MILDWGPAGPEPAIIPRFLHRRTAQSENWRVSLSIKMIQTTFLDSNSVNQNGAWAD